ncbi:hypothetical protein E5288_WYG012902 [Bos mutus]|uniref:Uncharacterized protein n=1 Tax=Bos mutus TaxID=72004 RepID=A0A6B0QZN6_9CETA|nr:hypothetical protein [Bos mutus]
MHGEPRIALAIHREVAAKNHERGPCAPLAASVNRDVSRQVLSRFLRRRVLCGLGSGLSSQTHRRNLQEGPSVWIPGATLRSTRAPGARGSGLPD